MVKMSDKLTLILRLNLNITALFFLGWLHAPSQGGGFGGRLRIVTFDTSHGTSSLYMFSHHFPGCYHDEFCRNSLAYSFRANVGIIPGAECRDGP